MNPTCGTTAQSLLTSGILQGVGVRRVVSALINDLAVGCFSGGASPYGALDMAGNVWEWCHSLYEEYPYRQDDGREAPEAEGSRVLRGGAFYVRILRDGAPVVDGGSLEGSASDCPAPPGSYVYRLEAQNPAGEMVSEERTLTVNESAPQNPLAGTRWRATAISGQDVLEGTTLTAAFGADGSLNGSAGCNSYSSRYLADGTLLSIFPPSVTGSLCAQPEGVMEQETAFLAALQSAGSFSLEAGQLFVNDINSVVLVEFVAY